MKQQVFHLNLMEKLTMVLREILLPSALLANNIHLVGRSFKYHRPRGIMSAGSEEPNAIVQVGNDKSLTEPNVRATEVEIYEGLEATEPKLLAKC